MYCVYQKLLQLGDETWIHYFEPQRKIDHKMGLTKKAKRLVIAKRCKSTKKVLYAIFFSSEGPVVQVAIPKGRSITGHVYTNYVLKKVIIRNITKKRDQSLEFATFDFFMTAPQHINPRL